MKKVIIWLSMIKKSYWAGNDERGTYYAIQTFAQLLKEGKLPEVEIKDYPSVRYRGVVEGFYGTPWSHQARLRQLKFYGENKMNTYIYGPKRRSVSQRSQLAFALSGKGSSPIAGACESSQ